MFNSKQSKLCMKDIPVVKLLTCGFIVFYVLLNYIWSVFFSPYKLEFFNVYTIILLVLNLFMCILLVTFTYKGFDKNHKQIISVFSTYNIFMGLYYLIYSFIEYDRLKFDPYLYSCLFYMIPGIACSILLFYDSFKNKKSLNTLSVLKYLAILSYVASIVLFYFYEYRFYIQFFELIFDGSFFDVFGDYSFTLLAYMILDLPVIHICCIIFLLFLKVKKEEPATQSAPATNNQFEYNGYDAPSPYAYAQPVYNQVNKPVAEAAPAPQPYVYEPENQQPSYTPAQPIVKPEVKVEAPVGNSTNYISELVDEPTVSIFTDEPTLTAFFEPVNVHPVINAQPHVNTQTENSPKPKFCAFCGAKLSGVGSFCTQCGKKIN